MIIVHVPFLPDKQVLRGGLGRILGNFKDNLYAEIREIVTTIKTHAETVKDAAAKGSMAETRVMHLKFDHQGAILRQGLCTTTRYVPMRLTVQKRLGLEELKNQAWANHLFLIWAYQNQQVQNRGSRELESAPDSLVWALTLLSRSIKQPQGAKASI